MDKVLLLMLAVFLSLKVRTRTPPPFEIVNRKGECAVCYLFVLTCAMHRIPLLSWILHMSGMCELP